MKKIILSSFLVFMALNLFAQNISIGVNTNVAYRFGKLKKASELFLSAGGTTTIRMSNHLSVNTGLDFLSFGRVGTTGACALCLPCYCPDYAESQRQAFSIPLNFSYTFSKCKRIKPIISLGISPVLFSRGEMVFIEPDPLPYEIRVPVLYRWDKWHFKLYNLFFNLSPGFIYSINDKFNITTQGIIKYDITEISYSTNKPYGGIGLMLLYNFNKNKVK